MGHVEIVKMLVEQGADLDKEAKGFTPVHYAVALGNIEVVKMLAELGADLDKERKGLKYFSPIQTAVSQGHIEIVKILAEQGVDLNKPVLDGRTPIHFAAWQEVVKILAEH